MSSKKKVPWKDAWQTSDQPYHREVPLLKVGEDGTPQRELLIDLESKDLATHWQQKEPQLWFVIAICCLYFVYILVLYG